MPVRYRMSEAYRLHGLRSDVVGRCEVGVVKNISIVGLHPLRDALLVCPSAISSAHNLNLASLGVRPRNNAPGSVRALFMDA